MIKVYLYL